MAVVEPQERNPLEAPAIIRSIDNSRLALARALGLSEAEALSLEAQAEVHGFAVLSPLDVDHC
jgi:hypothetical protein